MKNRVIGKDGKKIKVDFKNCRTCQTTKEANEFNRDKSRRDGLDSQCKICSRERRRKFYYEHREEELKHDHEYRKENHAHRLLQERNYKYGDKGRATTRHYWHIRQMRKGKTPILLLPCNLCLSSQED